MIGWRLLSDKIIFQNSRPFPIYEQVVKMMNGRMRSMLIRNQAANGMISDTLPKSVQFDESSDNYRCFCNAFHVKTGALLISGL